MKTMKWLLRREFWEHKGAMLWAPAVVGAVMIAFITSVMAYGALMGEFKGQLTMHGKTTELSAIFNNLTPEKQQELADVVSTAYMGAAAPLLLMMSVIAFFYCLGALFEERRDRSILFWKSLPVSDAQTVLAKVITASVVTPVITIAIAMFVSMLLLIIVGTMFAFHGVNLFGLVLSNANFYLMPLRIIGLLPVYILWALPTIGWLLMVSAWAKSKVFLWAVGVPVITIVVIKWVDHLMGVGIDIGWFAQNVVSRGLVGLIPGIWLPLADVDAASMVNAQDNMVMGAVFTQSWKTLATLPALLGAVAGAAMILAAIRLRRWKDEG